jgi:hypothetical protein
MKQEKCVFKSSVAGMMIQGWKRWGNLHDSKECLYKLKILVKYRNNAELLFFRKAIQAVGKLQNYEKR